MAVPQFPNRDGGISACILGEFNEILILTDGYAQEAESWSIRFTQNLQSPYGLRLEGSNRYPYGDLRQHRWSIWAAWGDVHQIQAHHVLPYTDLGSCRKSMQATYWLTQQVAASLLLRYGVTDVDPVAKRLTAS